MKKVVIRPAALSVYAARGALAIAAAVLQSSGSFAPGETVWRWQDGVKPLGLDMFIACLPPPARRWPRTRIMHWKGATERLRTALLRAEIAA